MNKRPLWVYVTGVLIALVIINSVYAYLHGAFSQNVTVFSLGFLVGMLAMYIAVHLYKEKAWPISQ